MPSMITDRTAKWIVCPVTALYEGLISNETIRGEKMVFAYMHHGSGVQN